MECTSRTDGVEAVRKSRIPGITSAIWPRCSRRRAAGEQRREHYHGVGDIDPKITVEVTGILTRWRSTRGKESIEMKDDISDVEGSIIITVAANELRGRGSSTAGELIGCIEDATGRKADPDTRDLDSREKHIDSEGWSRRTPEIHRVLRTRVCVGDEEDAAETEGVRLKGATLLEDRWRLLTYHSVGKQLKTAQEYQQGNGLKKRTSRGREHGKVSFACGDPGEGSLVTEPPL